MIRLTDFTYSYPASQAPALGPITVEVSPGEFVGVLGPNGSGKSTLCYALAGFLPSHYRGTVGGKVQVGNLDPASLGPSAMVGTVGFVFQDPFSQITGARFTVREEVAFGLENMAVPRTEMVSRIDTALELTGLTSLAERSPFELSGGEQQRLALASVLALQPSVLILDEPTSQLDPQGARLVIEAVDRLTAERETTVILVEQRTEWLAAHADRTWVLEAGRLIAEGPPQSVLAATDLARRGVASSRYTQAARVAQERGWARRETSLPVTLDEAAQFFR